jgi:hypothetical protein
VERSKLRKLSEADVYQDDSGAIFILTEGDDPPVPELHLGVNDDDDFEIPVVLDDRGEVVLMRWPVAQPRNERPLTFEAVRFAARNADVVLDDATIARLRDDEEVGWILDADLFAP